MTGSEVGDDARCSAEVRSDMVDAARRFMSTPKVSQTPFEEQRRFLISKGLTDAEIDEAKRTLLPLEPSVFASFPHSGGALGVISPPPPPSPSARFVHFANSVVVLGGLSYAGYRFIRSVILPRFFAVPDPALEEQRQLQNQMNDLQNSMKFVMDSVVQTLQTVNHQQEQLNRVIMMMSASGQESGELHRLQTDISIVKSLLLNQNQFAAIPSNIAPRGAPNGVPAWQRPNSHSDERDRTSLPNGYQTPPTDVEGLKEDLVNDAEVEMALSTDTAGGSSV